MAIFKPFLGNKGVNALGALSVGGGDTIKAIKTGTFAANTSAIGQSSAETATFTLSGATTGDLVLVWPSTALDVGITLMANATVTATSTVTVNFVNETSLASTQTSGLTYRYMHFDLT